MEKLATSGVLAGVLDLTTTEVADEVVGGVLTGTSAGSAAPGAARSALSCARRDRSASPPPHLTATRVRSRPRAAGHAGRHGAARRGLGRRPRHGHADAHDRGGAAQDRGLPGGQAEQVDGPADAAAARRRPLAH
eukprot:1698285-Prymnesium_polylepis.2